MRETSGPNGNHRSLGLASVFYASFLCVALCGGYALGQSEPSTPPPGSKPGAASAIESTRKPMPKPIKRRKAVHGRSVRTGPRSRKFAMNPNAKWACDKQAVTLEPVWRGGEALKFEFDIRNEGTENLKIRAKGG